ncbi:ribonuclease-like [Gracilinanus agilis]|uniref:ribonuclease-like n=1 Tax=Gracilinanus agilis TaxID=191870 RepID=UPI001CFC70AC|nr:ribonuclease-like [Gracilinanus agilis]
MYAGMWTFFLALLLDLANFSYTNDFWRRHVDYPKSIPKEGENNYCTWMMKRRGMVWGSKCVQGNTFIHEKNSTIENICNRTPRPCINHRNHYCYTSVRPFSLSDCFLERGSHPPHCNYWMSVQSRKINVFCQSELPVHLED